MADDHDDYWDFLSRGGGPIGVREKNLKPLNIGMPIMVNVAVYAMRFATGPELPRELSFEVGIGGP